MWWTASAQWRAVKWMLNGFAVRPEGERTLCASTSVHLSPFRLYGFAFLVFFFEVRMLFYPRCIWMRC